MLIKKRAYAFRWRETLGNYSSPYFGLLEFRFVCCAKSTIPLDMNGVMFNWFNGRKAHVSKRWVLTFPCLSCVDVRNNKLSLICSVIRGLQFRWERLGLLIETIFFPNLLVDGFETCTPSYHWSKWWTVQGYYLQTRLRNCLQKAFRSIQGEWTDMPMAGNLRHSRFWSSA
jgi:hypothetical protein